MSLSLLLLAFSSSANTVASLGELRISGQDDHAMHVHGGAAAQLGASSFSIKNSGPETELSVSKVEYLVGGSCETLPETVHSAPGVVGLSLGEGQSPSKLLKIPKGKHDLKVHFAHVPAYYTHCDRFAFRVHFERAGETAVVVSETSVGREEPWEGDLKGPP